MPPPTDPTAQASILLEQNRARGAQAVLATAFAAGLDDASAHSLMGLVLHQLGDLAGCGQHLRRAVQLAPGDGQAQFAYASIAFRLGHEAEAEAAARAAIAAGMDDATVWRLLGRILGKAGELADSEQAWREAVRRDPSSPQAQRELAELVWMRTGNLGAARAALDASPQTHEIVAITVKLIEATGDKRAAYALAVERARRDPSLHLLAARAALGLDPQAAARHLDAVPPHAAPGVRAKVEIEVALALGQAEQAAQCAEALHAAAPRDQYATALLATAWRLKGDARYHALQDYDRLVKSYRITPPQGWNTLEDYLRDLGAALDTLHAPLSHPVGQSLRQGSQTLRPLGDYPDPAIRALFAAIDAPLKQHIAAIGETCGYDVSGAWSVRLNSGGFHVNHVHPEGWLSSAFHVRVPTRNGKEGFLKFGEPGPATSPPLGPDHLVRPEPGMLVLFPSYMWHGTVPFSSDGKRLSCAFDFVRA